MTARLLASSGRRAHRAHGRPSRQPALLARARPTRPARPAQRVSHRPFEAAVCPVRVFTSSRPARPTRCLTNKLTIPIWSTSHSQRRIYIVPEADSGIFVVLNHTPEITWLQYFREHGSCLYTARVYTRPRHTVPHDDGVSRILHNSHGHTRRVFLAHCAFINIHVYSFNYSNFLYNLAGL